MDSEGLSAWVVQDRKVLAMFQVFHDMGADLVVSANTIVEVSHARVNLPRLQWALSRVKVEPITDAAAKEAAQLLKGAGLHGHKHAIDATVAEAALRQPGPVAILTSDVDDMTRLCGSKVRMIGL
nr:DNA-binding protein [Streptomyces sp. SID8379]